MPFLDSSPWHFGQDAKSDGVSVQGSIEIWQAYISSSDLQAQYNSAKIVSMFAHLFCNVLWWPEWINAFAIYVI